MNMEAKPQRAPVQEEQIRAALDQHWAASDANDFETEHLIYHDDALLEYHRQTSEPAADATYRANAPVSRTRRAFLSAELLAPVRFGSQNSS
jgi:hypothetical protein